MLYKETVEPATLDLIRQLQGDPSLSEFLLVGGTALSFMIGHRVSRDIDLFTVSDFDAMAMLEHLEQQYRFSLQFMKKNTLKGIVDGVFVDLLTHPYPYVRPPVESEGIRMISREDIAAMKLNAISGNGTRAKDFIDVYFLLKEFSLGELLSFYGSKYAERNTFHVAKSLTWFDDMDEQTWPVMVREKSLTPELLKNRLIAFSKQFMQ